MDAKRRCNCDGSQKGPHPLNLVTLANIGRSRAALLAGASLVVLGALATPDRALAACSGANQTISSPSTPGPIFGKGTGGNITVDAGASVAGGPTGVYAKNCGIGTLGEQRRDRRRSGRFGRRGRHWGENQFGSNHRFVDQRDRRDDQRRRRRLRIGRRSGRRWRVERRDDHEADQQRLRSSAAPAAARIRRQRAARAARACRTPGRSRR